MPVIGLSIKSVEASVREKTFSGTINVNSAPVITGVKKKGINMPDLKEAVAIDFRFETSYEPEDKSEKVGEIIISGTILFGDENSDAIVQKWKKEKKLDDNMLIDAFNAIFRTCLTEAVHMAYTLRLPPPVSFPTVRAKGDAKYKTKNPEEYIG